MATTHESCEEYSSNVIRVLHPVGVQITNVSNVSQVDNNLDYLLEDLQSSVTPGSYISSSRDVQYLSPSNSTTIVRERSVSPGKDKRIYKSAAYQYSTAVSDSEPQQNVNQLDALLHDLKTERDITRERDFSQVNNIGVDSPRELPADITKSAHVYKKTISENKPVSQRELVFDSWDDSTLLGSPQKSNTNYVTSVETKRIRDVSYDRANQNVASNEKKVVSSHLKTQNLNANILPAELKDVPLSDDILPVPGTKVTTTVRTYTYEIPAEPVSTSTKTLLYKAESHNSENVNYPDRSVPQTVLFQTESYNTVNRNDAFSSPIKPTNTTTTVGRKIETRDVQRSIQPPADAYQQLPNVTNIYEQDVINIKNSKNIHPDPNWEGKYPKSYTPVKTLPETTYYYKHESANTKNTIYGPQSDSSPFSDPNQPIPSGTPVAHKPHHDSENADRSTTTTYKYSSLNSTSNTHKSPSEREPLMQPGPFPTDGVDHSETNGSTPRRLDELMASFNGNARDRSAAVDETLSRRKEVETALATPGEPKIPSKNIAGPPVYYPPGHEMFARKEEGAAAYRAQGAYSSASGRYEYEAESKSKSKTRSGAAVVPVCLPLCCAMPCSIM